MTPRPAAALPLKHSNYLVLLVLADGDLHAYGIKKEIAARTGGSIEVGPGSLHRILRQLHDAGLIAESSDRPPVGLDDERRRYFRLTRSGHRALAAETERLGALVSAARAAVERR